MGRELYDTEPVFRAAMDQCATLVTPHLTRPLLDVIWGKGDNAGIIDDTAFTQPALFAIEYSLALLWRSWGVEPTAAVGHSVGEYVAATLAGVFSLEDGLTLVAARARLMSALPRDGAMVAIFTDEETVRSALEGLETKVSIAAANGPANVVISGTVGGVEAALSRLTPRGIEFQRLNVSHAFHSHLMEPMLDEFEKIAANVTFNAPRFGLMSNLTGKQAGEEIRQPSYWRRHVREAVRFGDSIGQLLRDGYRLFLEVGPAPTLIGMARRGPGSDAAAWVGSLRRGRSDRASMLEGLGQLYVQGLSVTWPAVFGGVSAARPANLPTYPFQRRHYWVERRVGPQGSRLNNTRFGHSLLGGAVNSPLHIFESEIGTATHPWLRDHRFFEFTPFPATGFLELMLAAICEVRGSVAGTLRDVKIREGLFLPENGTVTVQVIVTPTGGGNHAVQVFSRVGESKGGEEAPLWRDHVSATHVAVDEARSAVRTALSDPEPFPVDAYYTKLTKLGVTYGPTFQGLRAVDCGLMEAIGDVALPEALAQDASAYLVHPALLDAAVQIAGMLVPGARDLEAGGDLYMPVGVERYSVRVPGARAARCHVQLDKLEEGARELRADIILFDKGDEVVAELIGLSYFLITRAALANAIKASSAALAREEWLFELAWHVSAPDQQSSHDAAGHWILLADASGVAAQLAARLESRGASVRLVYQGATTERGPDRWIANSGNAAEVARVISDVTRETSRPLSGVVSLWPLDSSASQYILEIEQSQRRLIEGVLNVVRPLSALPARLWIVTRGAQPVGDCVPDLVQSPLLGLGNVIGTEAPELRCVRIDLDPVLRPSEPDLLFDTVWHADTEDRIAFRDGTRQVVRLVPGALSAPSDEPRVLEITARGQLDNLQNRAASRRKPGRGEVELRVHATGLNFRDVLNALGMYPGDPGPLGNECAGVVTAVGDGVEHLNLGDEVISMADRSFATYVTASAALTVRKPPQMSFVEAATIPVAFLTAAYALRNLGRIQKGDRVLIHAATGGVGMAAIQIAKLAGAEIIGTAGSPAKRELAKALGVHHVADSRSLSFESEVQRVTGGEGIDIVLNSLAGDFIPAGLRVLRGDGGRFIEIGKTGVWDAAEVARRFPNVEYHALYLGEIAAAQPAFVCGMLEAMLPQFVANELQPLPHRVYPIDRAQDAFRFMAQGHHTGKLVITQRPPIVVSPGATYLITGGLGGIGLASARWLVEAGARHIVLLARREPSERARAEISELEMLGAEILVAPVDVADADKLGKLLDRVSRTMPPLRGVLHAAGSIDDGTLADQTWSRFERVMAPKVRGAWNLHTMTRSSPLDFFVMFSSGAAVLGAPGQSNYAAANTFMDSLAYVRRANGRPAVSINWGGWSKVGMAAEVGEQFHRRWADSGLKMIEPQLGVQMLQQIVLQGAAVQAAAMPVVRSRLPSHLGPLFAELVSARDGGGPVDDSSDAGEEVLARLRLLSGDELLSALVGFLSRQLIRVLALSASYKVDARRSLLDMGIDSLMATELRNRLQTTLKVAVGLPELLDGTVERLAATLAVRIAGDEARDGLGAPVTEAVHWEEGTI
jgi:acyl transferase domain-containing protein/NADPH:quinone reductase-like Zn-dependent oxidoreductase